MTSTQTSQVPAGYDDAHAAGWTYHRNGSSGVGFYAKVEDGALHVAWCVMTPTADDWDENFPVAASIPLPVLAGLAKLPAVGDAVEVPRWSTYVVSGRHVAEVADGRPELRVFDLLGEEAARIVVVSDLLPDADPRVAAFNLAEVLIGDASGTWHGDRLYDDACFLAAAIKEAQTG